MNLFFDTSALAKLFHKEAGSKAVEKSKKILRKHGRKSVVRSLDALQMATHVLISDSSWALVATAPHLLVLARHMGIKTIDPCE